MTSPLTKLISVAETATQKSWKVISTGPRDIEGEYFSVEGPPSDFMFLVRDADAAHIALHSPANMRKAWKAVEELNEAANDLIERLNLLGSNYSPSQLTYDLATQAQTRYDSALANFNQTLEEITK